MMRQNGNYLWFVAIVFGMSLLCDYAIFRTGAVRSPLFPLLMWIPGLVTIVFLIIRKEGFRRIGWGVGRWWTVPAAVLIPLAVSAITALSLVASDLAVSSGSPFRFNEGTVEVSNIKLMLGNQSQGLPFFIFNMIVSHVFFLLAGSIITLGEELGWRGYLQEKLLRRFGLIRGFVLLGLIWGYWHAPVILMGFNFPNNRVWGALIWMPLGTVFLGTFLGWLYLRSKSIWITALAHASGNLFSGIVFQLISVEQQHELPRQAVWIALWGVVAALCMMDLKRRKPDLWQERETIDDSYSRRNPVGRAYEAELAGRRNE